MRGWEEFIDEINRHVNEYDVEMATKVIRSAFNELDIQDSRSLMVSIGWRTHFIHNVVALIASSPDFITWSDMIFCLEALRVYPASILSQHVDIILSKWKNCLQKKYLRVHYNFILYSSIFNFYSFDMIQVLVRHGANVNFATTYEHTSLRLLLGQNRVEMADYLLEHGANALVKGVTPNHVLIRKRRACRDAWMALYTVVVKHCPMNRDVARNMIKAMVWGTRLASCWALKSGTKRIKGSF